MRQNAQCPAKVPKPEVIRCSANEKRVAKRHSDYARIMDSRILLWHAHNAMKYFFSYELLLKGRIVRKGKGNCPQKSVDSVERYLKSAYSDWNWDSFTFFWHSSESAAFKHETLILDAYRRAKGK